MSKIYLSFYNKKIACNEVFEYQPELYAGVEPEFLITNPNMSQGAWLNQMLTMLPLDHLPDNLRPKFLRGIQPPVFCFGIPFEEKQMYDIATRLGIAEFLTQSNVNGNNPKRRSNRPENLIRNIQATLDKLGQKILIDLGIRCDPELELVLDGTHDNQIAFISFLSSYAVAWPCVPEGLNDILCDYLRLEVPMRLKWYVHYEDCTWSAAELEVEKEEREEEEEEEYIDII